MKEWQKGKIRITSAGSCSRLIPLLALCTASLLLIGGVFAGCSSDTSEEPSKEIQTMLQNRFAAMNAYSTQFLESTQAMTNCYATNAVLDNYADNGANIQGATQIADYFGGIATVFGMQWEADGDPIQHDRYVIQRVKISQKDGPGTGASVHILEIDAGNQIAHEWVVGWVAD